MGKKFQCLFLSGTSSGQMGRMAPSLLDAWSVLSQELAKRIKYKDQYHGSLVSNSYTFDKLFNIILITDLISSISVLGNIPNFKSLVSTFCENKILRILEIPRNLKYLKHCSNNDLLD